jgi:hypothetical protein
MSLKNKAKMNRQQSLNELMIVNPGNPEGEFFLNPRQFFLNEDKFQYLGEDDTLYRVAGFGTDPDFALGQTGFEATSIGTYFLGEDGALYEVFSL